MEQEDLTHPSGRHKETVEDFDRFLPFVRLNGVSQPVRERFLDFLRELHQKTARVWKPSNCHAAEWMNDQVRELQGREGKYRDLIIEPVELKPGAHFWFVATVPGFEEELVIDPWGTETPGCNYLDEPETVVPFFGVKSEAPLHAQAIYDEGTKVKNSNFHVFHP